MVEMMHSLRQVALLGFITASPGRYRSYDDESVAKSMGSLVWVRGWKIVATTVELLLSGY